MRCVVSLCAVLLLCPLCLPQATKKTISVCDLNKFLAKGCSDDLTKCKARNDQLEKWYADNKAKYDSLLNENTQLVQENSQFEENANARKENRVFFAAGTFGFGVGLAYLLYKAVKKVWPLSSQHKQLAVLIVGAVWVAGAALYAIASSPRATASMTELLAMVYSLPGFLFGGIGFWWFGRRVVVRLF
jgi:hypothetical protein